MKIAMMLTSVTSTRPTHFTCRIEATLPRPCGAGANARRTALPPQSCRRSRAHNGRIILPPAQLYFSVLGRKRDKCRPGRKSRQSSL